MNYKLKNINNPIPHDSLSCLENILAARGIDDIENYIEPSQKYEINPEKLDNIKEGIELLFKHLNNNNNILLIVDSDTDGYCSSVILWKYIKDIYPNSNLFYVCHEHKGHGVDDLMSELEFLNYDLLIIPDAGSSSAANHRTIKSWGKDILVIDHHIYKEADESAIIINNQSSINYDNKNLCGAGVVYKFCQAIDKLYNYNFAEQYIDLCALANISDVMSFKHPETRYYVVHGLRHINNVCLKAMIEHQSYSLFKNTSNLTPIGIAFYITPLINSITRAGTMDEKRMLFESFINGDIMVPSGKRGAENTEVTLAEEMCRVANNIRSRQNREKEKAIEVLDSRIHKEGLLDNKILILQVYPEDNIRQELTGLVAQNFSSMYHRPTMLVRLSEDGYLKGSQRGNDKFTEVPNFMEFLLKSSLVESCAGHPNSSGVSLLASNKDKLLEYSNRVISDKGLDDSYQVDFIFSRYENIASFGKILAKSEYLFGNDIEIPDVVIESIPVSNYNYLIMGENKDSLKLNFNGVEYVRFKDANFVDAVRAAGKDFNITVYGRFGLNKYMGKETVQVIVEDYNIESLDEFDF